MNRPRRRPLIGRLAPELLPQVAGLVLRQHPLPHHEVEPLPHESPLWDMPSVIITPHVGGQSQWRIDDMTEFFCENLRRRQANLPLLNLVDKRLGFPAWTPR